MRIIICILFSFQAILSFAQFDYLYSQRIHDTIECRIVEIRPNYVAYIKKGEMAVDVKSTQEKIKIKLFQPDKIEGSYTTNDLMEFFRKSDAKDIIWFGLDFSYLKVCRKGPAEIYDHSLFESMNNFIIDRAKKEFFSLFAPSSFLVISGISTINLTPVREVNKGIDTEKIEKCEDDPFIPLDYIRKSVSRYNINTVQTGIGVVYFYNYINKHEERIIVTLVYFDIKTRTVLLSWTEELGAGGIGAACHWTSGLLEMINNIKKSGSDF